MRRTCRSIVSRECFHSHTIKVRKGASLVGVRGGRITAVLVDSKSGDGIEVVDESLVSIGELNELIKGDVSGVSFFKTMVGMLGIASDTDDSFGSVVDDDDDDADNDNAVCPEDCFRFGGDISFMLTGLLMSTF